jgi:hypothetical protein
MRLAKARAENIESVIQKELVEANTALAEANANRIESDENAPARPILGIEGRVRTQEEIRAAIANRAAIQEDGLRNGAGNVSDMNAVLIEELNAKIELERNAHLEPQSEPVNSPAPTIEHQSEEDEHQSAEEDEDLDHSSPTNDIDFLSSIYGRNASLTSLPAPLPVPQQTTS